MKYLLLSLLQGITEFIPVSSSGHLVFFQNVFGITEPMLSFDILLHVATALAVIIFLRQEIKAILRSLLRVFFPFNVERVRRGFKEDPEVRLAFFILISMVPAAFVGIVLKDLLEGLFKTPVLVSIGFFVTGTVLYLTRFFLHPKSVRKLGLFHALLIGIAQAAAIVPGISRSGSTIAAGMFSGIERNAAARYSFLLAVPTILGAAILDMPEAAMPQVSPVILTGSLIIAFISGYAALTILARMISSARFHYFSYYCWIMGIVSLIFAR